MIVKRKEIEALPWLRTLVAGLSFRRTALDLRPFPVGTAVDKVALEQMFSAFFGCPLSVPFHQCSRLIFIYMLLSPEGQTGKAWEPRKTNALPEIGER
jgi:hypothetical protein